MTERVKGMTLEQAGQVKNTEIAKELCLPPVKRKLLEVFVYSELTNSTLLPTSRGRYQVRNQGLSIQATQA